jgi:polyisoprenyl-teichoic acid--peptidoglycan teichoic acid transferase
MASTSAPLEPARSARHRSPAAAALLSFVFPGLGQAWAGREARAVIVAAPAVFVVGVAIGTYAGGGLSALVTLALDPGVIAAALVLNLVFLGYRGWAIVDGYRVARATAGTGRGHGRAGRGGTAVLAVLLALTVATHGLVEWVGWNGYTLVTGVFASGSGGGPAWGDDVSPVPTTSPVPTPTPSPTVPTLISAPPTPSPTPAPADPYWAEDGRLNLLLLGGDAGPGRSSIRTDTMILLSVDIRTSRAAMISFPRNLEGVPLPEPYASAVSGGRFPDLLNALWRYADERPGAFPGNDQTRGFRAVSAAIGHLAGVEVDGLAYVDLNGFVRVIDALGGLSINVPYRVYDARYPNENGRGYRVVDIRAGQHQLSGRNALAYARSRNQDSDYQRIERQQLVLLALRRQVNPCTITPRLPEFVEIAKDSLYTNIPIEDLPQLLGVAARLEARDIEQLAFTPGNGYPAYVSTTALARMRAAVAGALERAAAPGATLRPDLEPGEDGDGGGTPGLWIPSC